MRDGPGTALAEQMRSTEVDDEDCPKFRSSIARDGTSSAVEPDARHSTVGSVVPEQERLGPFHPQTLFNTS